MRREAEGGGSGTPGGVDEFLEGGESRVTADSSLKVTELEWKEERPGRRAGGSHGGSGGGWNGGRGTPDDCLRTHGAAAGGVVGFGGGADVGLGVGPGTCWRRSASISAPSVTTKRLRASNLASKPTTSTPRTSCVAGMGRPRAARRACGRRAGPGGGVDGGDGSRSSARVGSSPRLGSPPGWEGREEGV